MKFDIEVTKSQMSELIIYWLLLCLVLWFINSRNMILTDANKALIKKWINRYHHPQCFCQIKVFRKKIMCIALSSL